MRALGMDIAKKDVVFANGMYGIVECCTEDASGCCGVLVSVWQLVQRVAPGAFKCANCHTRQIWAARVIKQAQAWYIDDGDGLIVLHY